MPKTPPELLASAHILLEAVRAATATHGQACWCDLCQAERHLEHARAALGYAAMEVAETVEIEVE